MTETSTAAIYPSLRGRVAFVSGGASGLGEEFVRQLAEQGVHVSFVDIQGDAGRSLARELADRGLPEPLFQEVDVSDAAALRRAIETTRDELGPVTVLVNNAANDTRQKVDDVTIEDWEQGLRVNLSHHFYAAQAVAPMMREAGGGSIINLGSISAHIDLTDLPTYITANAGIEGLTRTLAREYGPEAIRVNCVIPGWVMTEKQLTHWVTPDAEASIERNQCLTRKIVPADVARMVLWLASDDSSGCTAQRWVVDGGWM